LARDFKRNEEEEKKNREDPDFLIRESRHEQEAKRMFLPDFDEDEVPPLE
jgi:hypothetical protein